MKKSSRRRWLFSKERLSQASVILVFIICCFNILASHLHVTNTTSQKWSDIDRRPRSSGGKRDASSLSLPLPDYASLPLSDHALCRADGRGDDSYVCEGPEYDQFADRMEQFVAWVHGEDTRFRKHFQNLTEKQRLSALNLQNTSATWGRHLKNPFPANATILAIGNSHTRQVCQAMKCQYPTLRYDDMEGRSQNIHRRESYYFIEFENHATLHLVTNHALFYSKHWTRYLEEMIHHKLQDIDALILGIFNVFQDAMNTTFMEVMMEKTSKLEDADFRTVKPPGLKEVASVYSGPIVAHSSMADWGWGNSHDIMVEDKKVIRREQGKERAKNIFLVDGRRYIRILGECSSDNWQHVGVCGDDITSHRCIGRRGGNPDLLVWDIIEGYSCLLDRRKCKKTTKRRRKQKK